MEVKELSLFDLMTAPVNPIGKYYNTNGLTDIAVKKKEKKITGQTLEVLQVLERFPDELFTANEILDKLYSDNPMGYFNTPLTSIRRAITDLTTAGKLTKTDQRRPGKYGEQCYCWRLKKICP